MSIDRRSLLKHAAILPLASMGPALAQVIDAPGSSEKADYTIRIATGLVDLSPEHIVSTTLYNGQFPGPLVRLTEGKRVVVDVHNDTDTPEQLHWHGQSVPVDVDGSAEEGTLTSLRMACAALPSCRNRRVSASTTPTLFR
jgi:FtsP/CotA-like multicopper oxidase with cupredoxin domain